MARKTTSRSVLMMLVLALVAVLLSLAGAPTSAAPSDADPLAVAKSVAS